MKYHNEIQRIICAGEKIPPDQIKILKSKSRRREVVFARQLIMYFLKLINGNKASYSKIAALYNQDHATALRAFRTVIPNIIETDRIASARITLYELQIRSIVDFEKNLIIDNFETTKERFKQIIDSNIPVSYELVTIYNSLLERVIKQP